LKKFKVYKKEKIFCQVKKETCAKQCTSGGRPPVHKKKKEMLSLPVCVVVQEWVANSTRHNKSDDEK